MRLTSLTISVVNVRTHAITCACGPGSKYPYFQRFKIFFFVWAFRGIFGGSLAQHMSLASHNVRLHCATGNSLVKKVFRLELCRLCRSVTSSPQDHRAQPWSKPQPSPAVRYGSLDKNQFNPFGCTLPLAITCSAILMGFVTTCWPAFCSDRDSRNVGCIPSMRRQSCSATRPKLVPPERRSS